MTEILSVKTFSNKKSGWANSLSCTVCENFATKMEQHFSSETHFLCPNGALRLSYHYICFRCITSDKKENKKARFFPGYSENGRFYLELCMNSASLKFRDECNTHITEKSFDRQSGKNEEWFRKEFNSNKLSWSINWHQFTEFFWDSFWKRDATMTFSIISIKRVLVGKPRNQKSPMLNSNKRKSNYVDFVVSVLADKMTWFEIVRRKLTITKDKLTLLTTPFNFLTTLAKNRCFHTEQN